MQLSDRILVMTYRPGKLKRMVEIKLPRPRTSEIVSSEAFGRYVAQIWSDLREEASRGMHDDEAAKLREGEHPMSTAAHARQESLVPGCARARVARWAHRCSSSCSFAWASSIASSCRCPPTSCRHFRASIA